MILYYLGSLYLIFFLCKIQIYSVCKEKQISSLESPNYIKVIVGIILFFFNPDAVRGVLVHALCTFFFLTDSLFLVEL